METMTISVSVVPTWELYNGARVGVILITPKKLVMEKSLQLATSNEVEYEALLAGMAMVNKLKGEVIEVYSDSRLVMGQVNGEFEARDECMQRYLVRVRQARV